MEKDFKEKILKALREIEKVDKKRLESVLDKCKKKRGREIIDALAEENVVSEGDLLAVLSSGMGLPPIDITRITLDSRIMRLVPEKLIRRYSIVPLSKVGKNLTLVVSDPTDILALDDVKMVTGCETRLVLASRNGLEEALKSFYKEGDEELASIVGEEEDPDMEVLSKTEGLDLLEMARESKAAPIVKMVDLIISEAIKKRASDIHVEPQEKSLRIRYRVDGSLHEVFDLPKKNQNAILARLKIMSNLDITETRTPQDGRFRIRFDGREIDFRVSVLPICSGNKVVMRSLDRSNLSVGMSTLGFLPATMADFKEALSRPYGIILVTGPTGSGKSTTLYSILTEMNVPERNILTIEDPVEYQVAGITQIAARPEIGLDFASGLRALLRQSPDIIMVGEVRDFETADIAIKASLTGQMVLTTLHTNDSVGAITRLVNMGVEPFLVASSLTLACAQRLLRKICPHCKVEADIPKELIKQIKDEYPEASDVTEFYKGKGCKKCNDTGYLGRMGTLETLLVDEEIREMINQQKSEEEIRAYLKKKGVRTLRENAMVKFIKGLTTLEEVLRAT